MADRSDEELDDEMRAMLGLGVVSDAATDTAKSLFALRSLDEQVAELVDAQLVPLRGDDEDLVFTGDNVTVRIAREPGRIHLQLTPADATVTIEVDGSASEVLLDASGAGSAACEGVVCVRVRRPDHDDLVTDPFIV